MAGARPVSAHSDRCLAPTGNKQKVSLNDALDIYLFNNTHSTASKEMLFYLTTHSTHFIYSYMVSDIW